MNRPFYLDGCVLWPPAGSSSDSEQEVSGLCLIPVIFIMIWNNQGDSLKDLDFADEMLNLLRDTNNK